MTQSSLSIVAEGPLVLAAAIAVAAGLVSFFSPCLVPLLPGYLSYVSGLTGADLRDHRARVATGASLFVFGFSAVFVSYGALFGAIGMHLLAYQRAINIFLGLLTIMLGLGFIGLARFGQRELDTVPRADLGDRPGDVDLRGRRRARSVPHRDVLRWTGPPVHCGRDRLPTHAPRSGLGAASPSAHTDPGWNDDDHRRCTAPDRAVAVAGELPSRLGTVLHGAHLTRFRYVSRHCMVSMC